MSQNCDAAPTPDTLEDHLFRVCVSQRYHHRRARHYQWIARGANAFTVIAGSGAVAALYVSQTTAATFIAVALSVLSALTLVFDPARRWYEHELLARRWIDLEGEMAALDHQPTVTPEDLANVTRKINAITRDEPASHPVVIAICDNETTTANRRWNYAGRYRLPWFLRVRGTWFAINLPPSLVRESECSALPA